MATTAKKTAKGNKNAKPAAKDYTKYKFNGEILGKSRLVLEVVKAAAKKRSGKILELFPKKDVKAVFDVVAPVRKAEKGRYFLGEDEVINTPKGKFAVTSQWGSKNIDAFIEFAKDLGFSIKKVAGHGNSRSVHA